MSRNSRIKQTIFFTILLFFSKTVTASLNSDNQLFLNHGIEYLYLQDPQVPEKTVHEYVDPQTGLHFLEVIEEKTETVFTHIQALCSVAISYDAYGSKNQKESLSNLIFSENKFTVSDIYLISNLSSLSKLKLPGNPPPGTPGNDPDQQYLFCVGHSTVEIDARREEEALSVNMLHKQPIINDKIVGILGVHIPLKHVKHDMHIHFLDGMIECSSPDQTILPTSGRTIVVTQDSNINFFFRDFTTDPRDFLESGILEPKGLNFEEHQERIGFSDIHITFGLDYSYYLPYVNNLIIGVSIIAPAGNKSKGSRLYEVELGNGGAWQSELFFNVSGESDWSWLNPSLYVSITYSFPFTKNVRIPIKKNKKLEVLTENVSRFSAYEFLPFELFDSQIPAFADHAFHSRVHYGLKSHIRIGNYFRKVANRDITLGIFYDFIVKTKDTISPKHPKGRTFNIEAVTGRTNTSEHIISWDLAYDYNNHTLFHGGLRHTIAGKNIAQFHEIFGSLGITF